MVMQGETSVILEVNIEPICAIIDSGSYLFQPGIAEDEVNGDRISKSNCDTNTVTITVTVRSLEPNGHG